jgi:hypothetical protein
MINDIVSKLFMAIYKREWDAALKCSENYWGQRTEDGIAYGYDDSVSMGYDPKATEAGEVEIGPNRIKINRRCKEVSQQRSLTYKEHIRDPQYMLMNDGESYAEGYSVTPNLFPKESYQALLWSKAFRPQRLEQEDLIVVWRWLDAGFGFEYHFRDQLQTVDHFHLHLFIAGESLVFEKALSFIKTKDIDDVDIGFLNEYPATHLAFSSRNARALQKLALLFSNSLQGKGSNVKHSIVFIKEKMALIMLFSFFHPSYLAKRYHLP